MAKYSEAQICTLKQLRTILFEMGFNIHNIVRRYRKHPLEFVAANIYGLPYTSVVVRLFRGKVRIRFFEARMGWDDTKCKRVLALNEQSGYAPVFFASGYRNQTPASRALRPLFKQRFWHEFVYKREQEMTGLSLALQQFGNAGITFGIGKGLRAPQ